MPRSMGRAPAGASCVPMSVGRAGASSGYRSAGRVDSTSWYRSSGSVGRSSAPCPPGPAERTPNANYVQRAPPCIFWSETLQHILRERLSSFNCTCNSFMLAHQVQAPALSMSASSGSTLALQTGCLGDHAWAYERALHQKGPALEPPQHPRLLQPTPCGNVSQLQA